MNISTLKRALTGIAIGGAFGLGCAGAGVAALFLMLVGLGLGIALNAVLGLLLSLVVYYGAHFVFAVTIPFLKLWIGTTAGITVIGIIRTILRK